MAAARIGISGWRYARWRGDFYPKGLPQRRELEYAAGRLTSIEINGSFYALQRPSHYRAWAAQTPDDFVFAVKGGRFATHLKRLKEPEVSLPNFFASGPLLLGGKLGPFLWQLPASIRFERDVLAHFLDVLPKTAAAATELGRMRNDRLRDDQVYTGDVEDRPLRHALEPRHPSFGSEDALALLKEHGVAMVMSDAGNKWPRFDAVTADFAYARLHGAEELYASGYDDEALDEWAARAKRWLADGLDVFVYFDNDIKVRAPFDAIGLIDRLR